MSFFFGQPTGTITNRIEQNKYCKNLHERGFFHEYSYSGCTRRNCGSRIAAGRSPAGKVHRGTAQDIVVFTQDRFGVVHRQVVREIAVYLMIILKKILSLRKRYRDRDHRKTAEDPRKAEHDWPGKRELFAVKCHELYIVPDGEYFSSADILSA